MFLIIILINAIILVMNVIIWDKRLLWFELPYQTKFRRTKFRHQLEISEVLSADNIWWVSFLFCPIIIIIGSHGALTQTDKTYHLGVECSISTLSQNNIRKCKTWSALEEILRYLQNLEVEEKRKNALKKLELLVPRRVGKPL